VQQWPVEVGRLPGDPLSGSPYKRYSTTAGFSCRLPGGSRGSRRRRRRGYYHSGLLWISNSALHLLFVDFCLSESL